MPLFLRLNDVVLPAPAAALVCVLLLAGMVTEIGGRNWLEDELSNCTTSSLLVTSERETVAFTVKPSVTKFVAVSKVSLGTSTSSTVRLAVAVA